MDNFSAASQEAVSGSFAKDSLSGAAPPRDGVKIEIPSRTEWVRVIRLAVLGIASRMRFTYDDVEDIKLAVSEACNNAILHSVTSSPLDGNGSTPCIQVTITPYTDRLEIRVADPGQVAHPDHIPAAHSPGTTPHGPHNSGDLPESGLGLFLMRTLMDEVEHYVGPDRHTEVRLIKRIPTAGGLH